jgi:hypothetical protein
MTRTDGKMGETEIPRSERSKNKATGAAAVLLLAFTLANASPANADVVFLRLNHEAMKFRLAAERQIEVMRTLQDTLQLCTMLFPVRVSAVSKSGSTNVAAGTEKIYKKMLSMKSSAEIFKWMLEFLSEDESLLHILQKTFIHAKNNKSQDSFLLDGTEFYVRWFWLYPTQDGLLLSAQDEMTQEMADKIWDTQILFPVYELHFPIPPEFRESSFWQKGVMKILKAFPSAHISEEPAPELVYSVFPSSSGIPNIIRRSVELLD